jgi:hypothetical protein
MKYAYVGAYPRHLASGRPLVFGDVVDDKDLTPEDKRLTEFLVKNEAPGPSTSNTEES